MEANVAELLDCAYISWFVIFVHHRIYDSVLREFHTIQELGYKRFVSSNDEHVGQWWMKHGREYNMHENFTSL